MIVYKITNNINGKIYIGITEKTICQRFKEHVWAANRGARPYPLYKAILKYGAQNFSIEQIDVAANRDELRKKEIFYIAKYKANIPGVGYNQSPGGETNGGSDNPRAKLNEEDVWNIREAYRQLEPIGCIYRLYENRISFSAFEKIWEGVTWNGVHMDVYSVKNKEFHKTNNKKHSGSSNGNALADEKIILEARKFYVSHTLAQTFDKFGKEYANIDSFRRALTYGYKNIPIYKKQENKWYYKNDVIDITTFNPVSTIPVSGK